MRVAIGWLVLVVGGGIIGCSGQRETKPAPEKTTSEPSASASASASVSVSAAAQGGPATTSSTAPPPASTAMSKKSAPTKKPLAELLCSKAMAPSKEDEELAKLLEEGGRCASFMKKATEQAMKKAKEKGGDQLDPRARIQLIIGALGTKPEGVSDADFAFCSPKIKESLAGGIDDYLVASKVSEAKNSLGAMRRGAAAAFERETMTGDTSTAAAHTICKSATPVPAAGVPKGTRYTPEMRGDYALGDEQTGWKCLRFSQTLPQFFQYGYNAGSGYQGVAYGGPDPGKDGFEIWAAGDLDGDGETSLFWYVATVKDDQLEFSDLYCVNPKE